MAGDPKDVRTRAEARFSKAQRTTEDATAYVAAELHATRKKTARLKEARLAQEARDGRTAIDKKPQPTRSKPKRKA
jgi:hypothetical protein